MRTRPELSYRGALKLLGQDDSATLRALDTILGGAILAAGIPGAAAFGWVDQKNQAMGLVRKLLAAATDRLHGTAGKLRQDLVVAAHTTIVGAALFEALRAELGAAFAEVRLDDEERHRLGAPGDGTLASLYEAPAPIPTAVAGFHETAAGPLADHYTERAGRLVRFLEGLAVWPDIRGTLLRPDQLPERLAESARAAYVDHYLRLAAAVPEFLVWTLLGDHAATRAAVRAAREDVRLAVASASNVLERLERLLTVCRTPVVLPALDPRTLLHSVNRALLDQPLLLREAMRHIGSVEFPLVADSYVTPSFRVVRSGPATPLGREDWWDVQPECRDLDALLAAHLGTPESHTAPLLVLGHPGAGKSLLTKVVAGRLPIQTHTVVRVPLRNVDADAPVYEQIQQALRDATSGRVDWADLTEASRHTTRVVLLDGLDELLQASSTNNSGYLQRVAEFQRQEAAMGLPVVVVVTSRTLVMDRVSVPKDTPVLRIDDFDDAQVRAWLDAWHRSNAAAARSGAVRLLSADAALASAPIVRQPLLLMMLALYAADPAVPDLDADALSTAGLYGRLLENFVRREVVKTDPELAGGELDDTVRLRCWHLGVAAFAMFNRAQQAVSEEALNADLLALPDPPDDGGLKPARRTVGQFFFVHTAQADGRHDMQAERSYEFLHATFGEYLVADQTVRLLVDLAGRMPPAGRQVDDDLLHALLSHQTLATRERILPFARDILACLDGGPRVLDLLARLVGQARRRSGGRQFAAYAPLAGDPVRSLAAYTSNLVLLRTALDPGLCVPLADLAPRGADPAGWWWELVWLWRAGINAECRRSVLSALGLDVAAGVVRYRASRTHHISELAAFAYLSDDSEALAVRVGHAATYGDDDFSAPADDAVLSYAIHAARSRPLPYADPRLRELLDSGVALTPTTARLLLPVIRELADDAEGVGLLTGSVLAALMRPVDADTSVELALLVARRPRLLDEVQALNDAAWYRTAWHRTSLILRLASLSAPQELRQRMRDLSTALDPRQSAAGMATLALEFWGWYRTGSLVDRSEWKRPRS